jgi:Tfp pilus assembly protein PilN
MAQQINLYSPILQEPRRYFSAMAMVQALGLFLLAVVALSGWSVWRTHALERDLAATGSSHAAEKQRLMQALAQRPARPADTAALEQELAQAERQLAERQHLLEDLGGNGAPPSALLQLLAQTVPAPVWLTEIRWSEGRLELSGLTLQPEALRPWLGTLARHPLAHGQALGKLRVERRAELRPGGAETWSFQFVQGAVSRPEEAR